MKTISTLILTFLFTHIGLAQHAYFGTRGSIQFDKVTYTRAAIRDMMNKNQQQGGMQGRMFGGGDLSNIPESSTQKLTLAFDENSTLLTINPTEESGTPNQRGALGAGGGARFQGRQGGGQAGGGNRPDRAPGMGARNRTQNQGKILYQDLKKKTSEVQIEIDEKYLLSDSLQNITWRFTDEYRNIAGFDCRRVNGATADSLYIIAFYTEQIPVSAGPALTQGLPGMIMGLVIPEMHIQYWATSVSYSNDSTPNDWKDKKAKPMTLDVFSETLGRYFNRGRDNRSNRMNILEQLIY